VSNPDTPYPLTWRGFEWANGVLDGSIPACQFVKLAAERFRKDLERDWQFEFDPAESERWLAFLARLPHIKGRWAGELFQSSGYQCFVTMNLYGWRHRETRLRRFREGYIEVGRKNGKSFWFGGLGVGHLCIDGEPGAEVYCGATSEAQAWEVFRPARAMCLRAEEVADEYGIEVHAKSLWILADGSRFQPVIGDPGDGSSPSCAIIDEFHEHKDSRLVDTMVTGMGAREQPMLLTITTAGSDFGGPCRAKRQDVVRILEGSVVDETVFGIIFTLDDGDDWTDPANFIKANPNLDVSISRDFLLAELEKAKRSPTKQAAFKTKHLNLWVGAKAAWMNMLHLQRCKTKLDLAAFDGKTCMIGVDLASKVDLAAVALLFPGDKLTAFFRFYLPEARVYSGVNDRYVAWAESGAITVTPGDTIDFSVIEEDLEAFLRRFDVPAVAYDPYQATQFAQQMLAKGAPMVEIRATVLNFSEPMKELEKRIVDRAFQYDDDVFTWMVGNVVAKLDKKDNIYPDRERVENKIDGAVAAIMAMNRVLAAGGPSVYETRGVLTV